MTYLTDHSINDVISPSHLNLIKDMIDDGSAAVNTLSLNVGGTEVIDSSRTVKPAKIIVPVGGLEIYASNGVTLIAKIDESGNLYILGGVGSL